MNSLKNPNSNILFPIVSDLRNNKIYGNHFEVNILLPDEKVCSYDCTYCNLGETNTKINNIKNIDFIPSSEIIDILNDKYNEIILSSEKVNTIVISGNGEPSLHPHFHEISQALKSWKEHNASDINLTLLTNGAHFVTKKSIVSTKFYDDVFLKIDCSDDFTLKKLNAPIVRQNLEKLLFSAQKIKNLSVQTMLVKGKVDNTTDGHFEDLIEVLGMLKPKKLILMTISSPVRGLEPADDITLYGIAQKLRKRIRSQIFIDL